MARRRTHHCEGCGDTMQCRVSPEIPVLLRLIGACPSLAGAEWHKQAYAPTDTIDIHIETQNVAQVLRCTFDARPNA